MIKTPLKKIEKSPQTAILYLFLISMSYAFVHFYLQSDLYFTDLEKYMTHVLFIGSTLFFCLCWLRDPGYLSKDPEIDFFEIIEKFDANHLCPEC